MKHRDPDQDQYEFCERCRYWERWPADQDEERGDCRRYAPRATFGDVTSGAQLRCHWLNTDSADWCGEFERI